MFVLGTARIGEFESGVAAALLRPVAAVVLGGVGTLVVTMWIRLFPELARRDRISEADPPPDGSPRPRTG